MREMQPSTADLGDAGVAGGGSQVPAAEHGPACDCTRCIAQQFHLSIEDVSEYHTLEESAEIEDALEALLDLVYVWEVQNRGHAERPPNAATWEAMGRRAALRGRDVLLRAGVRDARLGNEDDRPARRRRTRA
jgi:hypothetical protein